MLIYLLCLHFCICFDATIDVVNKEYTGWGKKNEYTYKICNISAIHQNFNLKLSGIIQGPIVRSSTKFCFNWPSVAKVI